MREALIWIADAVGVGVARDENAQVWMDRRNFRSAT